MLAGLVLISSAVGMIAVAATLALSLPTWMTLVAYPGTCSLTLLLSAAMWTIRNDPSASDRSLNMLGRQTDRRTA